MTKTVLISVAVMLAIGGCSSQTKEDVAKAAESVKQDTVKAADTLRTRGGEMMKEAKQEAAEAVEKVKEKAAKAGDAAREAASEAAAAAEKKAAAVKKELSPTATEEKNAPKPESRPPEREEHDPAPAAQTSASGDEGAKLYSKCAGCHGPDGRTKALGKSAAIAGRSAAELAEMLAGYKNGTRNVYGMGNLMRTQVTGLSDSDLGALAKHISEMK